MNPLVSAPATEGAAPTSARLDLRGLSAFVGIAFALAWVVSLPLWIHPQHLAAPWARVIMAAMMYTPAIAAFVVTRRVSPAQDLVARTGLRLRAPGRRVVPYWVLAWLVPPILVVASMLASAALGTASLDLEEFSGFRELILQSPAGKEVLERLPLRALVLLQIPAVVFAPVINAVVMFGEEYGWRGYLLPRLLPLGQWRALVLSGAIWGLWHAPVILLGYNYPRHPVLGLAAMTVVGVLLGILFGWLRLASGSVWPAVIAHGALNGSAGLALVMSRAGEPFDSLHASLLGWPGWALMALAIAALVALRQLPVRDAPDEVELRSDRVATSSAS